MWLTKRKKSQNQESVAHCCAQPEMMLHVFTCTCVFISNYISSHVKAMGLNVIVILPVATKDLPSFPRFTPYDFLSRCKFSTLTTRQPMVEFYLLTFSRFPPQKK